MMNGEKVRLTGTIEEIRRIDVKPGETWVEITLRVNGDKVLSVARGHMAEEMWKDLEPGEELEIFGSIHYPPGFVQPPDFVPCARGFGKAGQ